MFIVHSIDILYFQQSSSGKVFLSDNVKHALR